MDFNAMIDKIMPEVRGGTNEPIIIYRDKTGNWHGDFTRNQYGEEFDWVADAKEQDPLALTVTGADFAKGSFLYVYDKIILERLRLEYNTFYNDGTNTGEQHALINFIEDNIREFSHGVTNYLMELDRPFAALNEIIPEDFKNDLADDIPDAETIQNIVFDFIEEKVAEALNNRNHYRYNRTDEIIWSNGQLNINKYEEHCSIQLAGRQAVLAENMNADNPFRYMTALCRRDNPLGIKEYYNVRLSDSYLDAIVLFITDQRDLLRELRKEREKSGLPFQTLTEANCIPDSVMGDLKDKLIIIKPEAMTPEYRSAEYQLKYCIGGFGAKPRARGNAVFCKDFYSGENSRFERMDVAGVADKSNLPEWVIKKIALEETLKEPSVFEYSGKHFKPYRKFTKRDGDFRKQLCNAINDRELGISKYEWQKSDYDYTEFYTASGNSDFDIFRCIENGKLYVPGQNELFKYNEPPQKSKTTDKKPSLSERIEKGKEKVREVDKNREKPAKTKIYNKGVDD